MLNKAIILTFLITLSTSSFPQKFLTFETYNVDSLMVILPGQTAEERVNTLNRLSISLFFEDDSLSMKYADEAMDLSMQLNYTEGMAWAFKNFGHIYQFRGNYPEALRNYYEALPLFEITGRKHAAAWIYYDISKTHFLANNFEKTLGYGNMALAMFLELIPGEATAGEAKDIFIIKSGLAETYKRMKMDPESLALRLEALRIIEKASLPASSLVALSWTIAVDFYQLEEFDSATFYMQKALSIPDENFDVRAQKRRALCWYADLLYNKGEIDTAIAIIQSVLQWYDENGITAWALYSSNLLGYFYHTRNDLKQAEKSYLLSEKFFDEILAKNSWYRHDSSKYKAIHGFEPSFPIPPLMMIEMIWIWGEWTYHGLYTIYQNENRTREALKYHLLYTNAGDTLNLLSRNRETIELQTRYETERKEKQIEILSQENEFQSFKLRQTRIFLFGLAGFVILLILFAIVLIRQGRLRERQKNIILQQKLFRSQMNPHFIFNSLSSIHHFMIHEEPSKAASYLSRFSKLIRAILHSSVEEYISLGNEISTIENYLELQKVRFPDKFEFNIEVDDQLDIENTLIPSMITQPFVENAIEHGIKQKTSKGNIQVRYLQKGEMLVIEVEDDGIGRSKAKELSLVKNKDHTSISTSIIRERIRSLNRALKKKIRLDILDLKNEKGEAMGTKVVLEIPLL